MTVDAGVDGAPVVRVHAAKHARAGLVLAHGVMSHAGWFDALATSLAARGVTVAAVDRAGSGAARSRAGGCDPERWITDLVTTASALANEIPAVGLLGWCWGARAAILAASRCRPAKLLLVAPGLAVLDRVRTRAAALAAGTDERVPLPFDIEDFSDDEDVLRWIRQDTLAWRDQPRAFLAPSRAALDEALRVLPGLELSSTILLARDDRIVDNAAVERIVAPRSVAYLPGGHALVLESPDRVADEIARAFPA